jgi:hypothetical protein
MNHIFKAFMVLIYKCTCIWGISLSQFQWCRREYSWKNLGGGIVETDKALGFFDW